MKESPEDRPQPDSISLPVQAVILISAILILWFGVYPGQVMNLAGYSVLAIR